MVFSIFCLRGILHGVHAWLVSFTGDSLSVFPNFHCLLIQEWPFLYEQNGQASVLICVTLLLMPLDIVAAGISGWVFRTTTGWMDIPDSLCEVVISFWLLVATHTALGHLATFASDVLSSPDQPTASAAKVADSDAPDGTRLVSSVRNAQDRPLCCDLAPSWQFLELPSILPVFDFQYSLQ